MAGVVRPQAFPSTSSNKLTCDEHTTRLSLLHARTWLVPPPCRRHRRGLVHLPSVLRASLHLDMWPGLDDAALDQADRESAGTVPRSCDTDTIASIVTGAQQGAVSIIRISGGGAVEVAQQAFQPAGVATVEAWSPESHRVYYGHAVDPDGHKIDEVLTLVMLAPRSYTAEDVVEIHAHGGTVCASRVLQACLAAGARLARPGEFTLRAFLNGRLDLSQAESVAALVGARTAAAADSALAGLDGGLGREVAAVRLECLETLAELDARLDFDEDLPPLDVAAVAGRLQVALERVQAALSTAQQGRLLRSGLQVALVGRPNVGKSSLLNAVSGTERSIVTSIAGTTRDVVEAAVVVGGIPVTLLDTAGVRESIDEVERIGVQRSVAAARQADIVVMVADAGEGWTPGDQQIFADIVVQGSSGSAAAIPSLLVLNKVDLQGQASGGGGVPPAVLAAFSAVVRTSACTGTGLEALRSALLQLAGAPELAPGGVSWAVNERQGEALLRAAEALGAVQISVAGGLPLDFWTIDLRSAVISLGEVSGEEVTEEVLDQVFSRFCIGK